MTRLWASRHPAAAAARLALRPVAMAYGTAVRARAYAYAAGWCARRTLPLPTVGVGSLRVGGAGKTPVAAWVGGWFADHGFRPGILLRGYGGDEGAVHRELVPGAVVVEDADRVRGSETAMTRGARVLVLDDNFQHLRVAPDLQLLLVTTEHLAEPPWLLPAGPWREPLGRAAGTDLLVLVRRTAADVQVDDARGRLRAALRDTPVVVARLGIAGWRTTDGAALPETALRGRPVLALCGVADPRPFLAHVHAVADVRATRARRDHARYGVPVVKGLVRAAEQAEVDYVLTTAKDAVKLRRFWPAGAPALLVAQLAVTWEHGRELVEQALAACADPAAVPPRGGRVRPTSAAPGGTGDTV
jgi:tetraacyldisaccharide 4'-kinase